MKTVNTGQNSQKLFIVMLLLFSVKFLNFCIFFFANSYFLAKLKIHMEIGKFLGSLLAACAVSYQIYECINMFTIYWIYLRLSLVSDSLREMENNQGKRGQNVAKEFKKMFIIVDKICDALESIKLCHSISIVAFIVHYVLFSVFTFYGIVSYFFRRTSTEVDLIFNFLSLVVNLLFAPFCIWMFLMSNWIKKRGNEIENRIHKTLHENRLEVKVYKRAEIIFMQLRHRRPIVSCGVFIIDWHLLLYLMNLCFTYLVIIVQFELKTFND